MTNDELYELCDASFGEWIVSEQEGEIVISTGLTRDGDKIIPIGDHETKYYGGRKNNKRTWSSTHRIKTPPLKSDIEIIK